MAYKLSLYAEKDIEQILAYTLKTWGINQFHAYRTRIAQSLDTIGNDPKVSTSRRRDHLFPGCRSYACEKHVIFYREKDEQVEVVRILHQRMDFDAHIPDEFME